MKRAVFITGLKSRVFNGNFLNKKDGHQDRPRLACFSHAVAILSLLIVYHVQINDTIKHGMFVPLHCRKARREVPHVCSYNIISGVTHA